MSKLSTFIFILSALVCLFTLLGYLGDRFWLFDLCAHFKLQYAVILLVFLMFFLAYRRFYIAISLFLFLAVNLYEVGALYFSRGSAISGPVLKISSINLWSSNTETQKVIDYIHRVDPDMLILQEFNERWYDDLHTVLEAYPYQKAVVRTDNFGIAIYSKVALQSTTKLNLSQAEIPSLLATIIFQDQLLHVLATHPLPPVGLQYFTDRNRQLAAIASVQRASGDRFMVIGDLNTSSYAPNFKKLLADTQLEDSRQGFGVLPTWPAYFFPMMVTIDHCLVSKQIKVVKRAVGHHIGSDHLPIYVEISL